MGRNNSVTDEMNGVSSVTYDKLGNVTKLQGPLGGATNYTYDNMGRLTAESTTSSGTVRYTYNELNLKKTLTNARGTARTYTYDANGRVKSYTDSGKTVSFTYDNNGNVLTVTDSNGTITRTFDALNRVTSCTDTAGKTIGYTYNAVGDLTRITYPDSTAVNYTYDANHNLITVTDWANRVTTYTYDVNNNVTGVTKPDGSVTTTVYDSKQRVTSHVERTASGAVITGFEYTYDVLGRISVEKNLAKNVKMCYTYDELSRVIKTNTVDLTTNEQTIEDFSYDAAGNISEGEAVYDANNRLTEYSCNYVSYDADGNMLNDPVTCDQYSYDFAKRLVTAGANTYTYNAEDTRIRAVHNGVTTTYTYDTNCKLSKLLCKTTSGTTTKYVYGLGLIGEAVGSSFKTYHFDYRGSTVAITNVNGTVTDTFTYNTYGKLTARTGSTAIIFGYNGRDGVITEPNGLLYMRARYYSPTLYRFINADIIPGQISNAVTLNRYAYANGNPVSNVDPFGLSAERGGYFRPSILDFAQMGANTFYKSTELIQTKVYNHKLNEILLKAKPKSRNIGSWILEQRRELNNVEVKFGENSCFAKDLSKAGKIADKLSNVADGLVIALDACTGIAENIDNGAELEETLADAVVDVGLGVAITVSSTKAGLIIGTLATTIPGIGPFVGPIAGAVAIWAFGEGMTALAECDAFGEYILDPLREDLKNVFEHSGDISLVCASIYTMSGSPMRVDRISFGDFYPIK